MSNVMQKLSVLVGEWEMLPDFDGAPAPGAPALVTFEWMPGQQQLLQRWEIPGLDPVEMPAAGIAVIGLDPDDEDRFLQHYFDSRGAARVYRMSLDNHQWRLSRQEPDFSPLDFSQRYTGTFDQERTTISGAWEICHDGQTWEHDFSVTYTKVR